MTKCLHQIDFTDFETMTFNDKSTLCRPGGLTCTVIYLACGPGLKGHWPGRAVIFRPVQGSSGNHVCLLNPECQRLQ